MRNAIYDPFSNIRRLQDEMNRAMGGLPAGGNDVEAASISQWTPAVDIHEEDDRFVITADVPGVEPDAIEVTTVEGALAISGERKYEREEGKGNQRRTERVYGNFYRRFTLPDTADVEHIDAQSKHGVLEVTIPKKDKVKPKRITVKA